MLDYIDALTALGHTLMGGFALGSVSPSDWFAERVTADPLILLRMFHYPPAASPRDTGSGASASTPTTGCSPS